MPTPTHARTTPPHPTPKLHCACCGRPFTRASGRGPAPLYCSADCRTQIRIRQRVWSSRPGYAASGPTNHRTVNHRDARFETACAS
ncbi:hypothetical protein [Azospirillum brasilense]|uniref:hypothetical protein n=1 Tax=Azospirillum brasilense TaxID=192 RepID=UPI001EDB9A83|nr:hypothetical protein [Azospirillum brasilense]UKJ77025.1 hypothetical protein H1Q64_28555 [Azospirillum brasilense]